MGIFHKTMLDVKDAIEKGDYPKALDFGGKAMFNISNELGALKAIMEKWDRNYERTMSALKRKAPKEEVLSDFDHCIIAARDAEEQIVKLKKDLKI